MRAQSGRIDKHAPEQKRITANVPAGLLEAAQQITGKGITETLIVGRRMLERSEAYAKAIALEGKIVLDLDMDALRERRR